MLLADIFADLRPRNKSHAADLTDGIGGRGQPLAVFPPMGAILAVTAQCSALMALADYLGRVLVNGPDQCRW